MKEDNVFLTDMETAASPNTGFAVHSVRPNTSHFAKPGKVRRNIFGFIY